MDVLHEQAAAIAAEFPDLPDLRVELVAWVRNDAKGYLARASMGFGRGWHSGAADSLPAAIGGLRSALTTVRTVRELELQPEVDRFRAWKQERGYPDE